MVEGLNGASRMIRFLFRALALLALAVAVILAVLDATRSIAASFVVTTPLIESWLATSPQSLQWVQANAERYGLWDPVLTSVLALPGFAVFSTLALIFYAVGRKPVRRQGRFAES
jgi:hypothetical protein